MSDVHLRWGRCIAALLLCAAAGAQADSDIAGQVRVRWDDRQPSGRGPLTLASQLAPELVPPPASSGAIESELRGHWRMLHVSLAARQEHPEGGAWHSDATVNELYAGGEAAGWHLSAGRKIVSWDVGYGFRPNDIVQQETRRTLLTSTPQGRAVLQAERFDADSAWSLVWINPQRPRNGDALARGPDEQALAMRLYRHDGSADWHGFARLGERTRGSVGAAVSWVATDTLELHASARWAERSDAIAQQPAVQGLVGSNPYREVMLHGTTQALIGANWTGENKLSLMAEAWFDGTAPSNAQWSQWSARNAGLAQMLSPAAPEALRRGVAGNLGWQGQSFVGQNLRRTNLYLRGAWDHEGWQPVLDMLYTPADGGRVVTASLAWQGNQLHLDAGVRLYGGPGSAVLAQLPLRRVVYLAATWAL